MRPEKQQSRTIADRKGETIEIYSRRRTVDESVPFTGTYQTFMQNSNCMMSNKKRLHPPINLRRILMARQGLKDITEALLYYGPEIDEKQTSYIALRDLLESSVPNPEKYFLANIRKWGSFRVDDLVLEKTGFKPGEEIVFVGKLDHIRVYRASDFSKD